MRDDDKQLIIRSEFAVVRLDLVGAPGCERLRVEDLRGQQAVHLDALELETLAWCRHEDLRPLLDPGARRWPSLSLATGGNAT